MPDVTPETNELFAKRYMSLATGEDLIEWAASLLGEGISAKNVGILAGLSMRSPGEVEDYFQRSLQELGWGVPDREGCLRRYAGETAAKILRDEIDPPEGCARIYGVLSALNRPRDLLNWSCLYLGHDPQPPCADLSGEEYDAAIRREARLLAERTHADD